MPRPYDGIEAWSGLLQGRARGQATIALRAPIKRAQSSGAGAFLGLADDGRQYWFKVPGNLQGNQVLTNEVIIEGVGRLLGAPVCHRELAVIPPSASRWGDYPIRESDSSVVAHASLHVAGAVDDDALTYTRRDDNARRQASLLALWDWCLGDDEQWLYDASNSSSIWSYDHGLWFTTGEGDWTPTVLERMVDLDGTFKLAPPGLDRARLREVAGLLDAVTPEELLTVMSGVPIDWGASDGDLEAMAWFLYRRAPAVAERTRRLAA